MFMQVSLQICHVFRHLLYRLTSVYFVACMVYLLVTWSVFMVDSLCADMYITFLFCFENLLLLLLFFLPCVAFVIGNVVGNVFHVLD